MLTKKEQRLRRARQTRIRIAQQGVARLSVNRTNLHIYASVISGCGTKVLASASTAEAEVRQALVAAASFLGQNPPDEWRHAASQATIADFWTWAQENWQLARVPRHPAKQMEEILP